MMANKKGTGVMMVFADIPADKEDDFNRWYNEEHLAELLSVPGVLSAARYEAVMSGPKHLAFYELESAAVIETDAFKNRPRTEWGQRVSPIIIGDNVISNVYDMIRPATLTTEIADGGMAPALQIGRMGVSSEHEDEWNQWYSTIYTTNYEKVPGCIRARRWRAVRGEPTYAVVYDLENENVSSSQEWLTQRDIDPSNERMRSLMTHAPGSPGIWKKTFQLP
jgi:hypothetical protein